MGLGFSDGPVNLPSGLWGTTFVGRQILIDNPILKKVWESTNSAWTGRGGFTDGARNILQGYGIEVSPRVRRCTPFNCASARRAEARLKFAHDALTFRRVSCVSGG